MNFAKIFMATLFVLFIANLSYMLFDAFTSGRSETEIMADLNGCIAEIPRFDGSKGRVAEWTAETGLARETAPYDYVRLLANEAQLCGDWYTRGPKLECDLLGDQLRWKTCIEAAMVPMIAKLDEITNSLEQQPEFLTPDYVMSASYRACRFAPPEGMTLEEEGILNTRCQLDLGHLALGQASLVRHIEAAR